jgi:NADPH:quinone reductase-like Zn-dependent oxidoreductase
MKAIVYRDYGSPDVLRYEEVEKPAPGTNEVLIRVRAASLNPIDWHFMRGTPYLMRMAVGLRKPKAGRLGLDVAGQVEAVGGGVTQFKPGDEVFGTCQGALAQFVCAPESALVTKPENVTFEQAASVPVAGFTALQGLRDKGRIREGQEVLINGAAGGVGTFAVQIGKSFGARVTGVCSTKNVDMVRSIGADRVVDYSKEDFTGSGVRYDLILDCVGNRPLSACRRVLAPAGAYVMVGGPDGQWLGPLARGIRTLLLARFVRQRLVLFLARPNKEDLTFLRELVRTGNVTPVIDRRHRLSEVPEAMRYLEGGHARGKVVATVEGDDSR